MPWLSLIMFLLSYLASRKTGASGGQALAAGLVAGGLTYEVSHNTSWGRDNLGSLDGVDPVPTADHPDGSTADDSKLKVPTPSGPFSIFTKGGLPTLVAGAAAGSLFGSPWVPWILGGIGVVLLLRN